MVPGLRRAYPEEGGAERSEGRVQDRRTFLLGATGLLTLGVAAVSIPVIFAIRDGAPGYPRIEGDLLAQKHPVSPLAMLGGNLAADKRAVREAGDIQRQIQQRALDVAQSVLASFADLPGPEVETVYDAQKHPRAVILTANRGGGFIDTAIFGATTEGQIDASDLWSAQVVVTGDGPAQDQQYRMTRALNNDADDSATWIFTGVPQEGSERDRDNIFNFTTASLPSTHAELQDMSVPLNQLLDSFGY